MLPPGHIAAGFITAKALLYFSHPTLSPQQQNQLLWWGMLFGFLPDLDSFITFGKEKAFITTSGKNSHRKIFTHAPLVWLAAAAIVIIFAPNTYWRYIGLLLWLGSWSHFFLDSIQYGIMWLWPFSPNLYAFSDKELNFHIQDRKFVNYWTAFIKAYTKQISFYLELVVIISACIIYFR